ncbi:Abi family protein [Cronobacter muytjensii]|jgi:hypothetical protein|uniref:Abi family protein n=1 Tax=Cronobacter TaxID=413496 RepID=UPI0009767C10|nr:MULTISPECIES: Abi family protein [Cronobacter]ELY4512572.1 Abi family protein [Cronobacter dublinensis]MDI6457875.1 Abi family protein [Cronobacter muytjensii]MDT3587324.1 Abi family protein [Cronobacter sakazakii]
MPQNTPVTNVLPLISTPRLGSYIVTFKPVDDHELYGTYIWSQLASGSVYPLLQNLEITLRNAVDVEARRRFGDKWWDNPGLSCGKPINQTAFYGKIVRAIDNLNETWKKKQRKRKKPTYPLPQWSHDQIIAATDFSAWHFILNNDFAAPNASQNKHYLWPISTGRVFRTYNSVSTDEKKARARIQSLIVEMREYRNRLSHNEPIWVKAPNVSDAATAIDTIRNKIRKIGALITLISPDKHHIMEKMGLFSQALRTCSVQELAIHSFHHADCALTRRQRRNLRGVISAAEKQNQSQVFDYAGRIYSLHLVR